MTFARDYDIPDPRSIVAFHIQEQRMSTAMSGPFLGQNKLRELQDNLALSSENIRSDEIVLRLLDAHVE